MIFSRLLIAFVVILLAYSLIRAISWFIMHRRAKRGLGLAELELGKPAILYFTTPDCLPCQTVQRPALQSISDQYGDLLQIITIDAYQNPKLADSWGVLSVPTTFIIDRQGRPRGVNHGVARFARLKSQLEQMDQSLADGRGTAVLDVHKQAKIG